MAIDLHRSCFEDYVSEPIAEWFRQPRHRLQLRQFSLWTIGENSRTSGESCLAPLLPLLAGVGEGDLAGLASRGHESAAYSFLIL
jgi:hypothetical protein